MIEEKIADLLLAEVKVYDVLATHDFGDGTQRPAIFAGEDEAPDTADNPCIMIDFEVGGPDDESRAARGAEAVYTVLTRWDKGTSPKVRRDHAFEIWKALARATVIPDAELGLEDATLACGLPGRITDAEGFPGHELTVTTTLIETVG